MDKENNKKLFIIKPSGYQYESFEPLLVQIEDHFKGILSFLKISTPSGKPTDLKLIVDVFNPEKISAYAKRVTKDPAVYEIRINAGLSYCIWTASRAFAIPEYDILSWTEECTVNDERLRKLSKKEVIADYAFFIGSY